MKKIKFSTNLYLFITVIILFILYLISFNFDSSKKDNRVQINSQLVNQKNKDKIIKFEINSQEKQLILIKNDDFWIATQDYEIFVPCDTFIMERFINDLTTLRKMYKLTDSLDTLNNNFGFKNPNNTTIRYYLDNQTYYDIIFGNQDFSFTSRYLTTGSNSTVFEIDTSLDKYLSSSIQIWSDPYLISRTIESNSNIEIQRIIVKDNSNTQKILNNSTQDFKDITDKLVELRHGGFSFSKEQNSPLDLELIIEYGNKDEIVISFYNSLNADNDYNIISKYKCFLKNKEYTFNTKVSAWTYNKIREIML